MKVETKGTLKSYIKILIEENERLEKENIMLLEKLKNEI